MQRQLDNGHRYQNRRGHLFQRNQKRNSGKERSNHRSFVRGYPAGAFLYSKTGGPSGGGIYDNDFGHHHKNIPNYSPSRRPGNVLSVEHHPLPAAADFKTDDELYQYDIDFYTDMDATGSGWQSWAQEYLEQGTIADRLIENMEPNTEYLVYAYGVDPITIERLTPISKKTLTTLAPQTIDTKFDIQIVSTEGLNIDVLVKANDYDGHFVAKIYGSVDAADTDATVLEKISESWIDNVQIYGWMGYTAEMILSQYTFQQSREIQETLEPNSKYYIYAFAVDDEALRCSDIVFIPITTNDTSIQH